MRELLSDRCAGSSANGRRVSSSEQMRVNSVFSPEQQQYQDHAAVELTDQRH